MKSNSVKVLYIDDEENNLQAFKASFRRQYEIYTANSAAEGLKLLQNVDIHVIIADQKMPNTTGVEFFQSIAETFPDPFKILLSHDPSHWEYEVKNHEQNFHLTLSGHTHGLQFGIEIPGFIKWSPVQYVYKQWAGLYENVGRYIYVNRGFGFHAYPGRVGIWPEITVIELKRGEKVA